MKYFIFYLFALLHTQTQFDVYSVYMSIETILFLSLDLFLSLWMQSEASHPVHHVSWCKCKYSLKLNSFSSICWAHDTVDSPFSHLTSAQRSSPFMHSNDATPHIFELKIIFCAIQTAISVLRSRSIGIH